MVIIYKIHDLSKLNWSNNNPICDKIIHFINGMIELKVLIAHVILLYFGFHCNARYFRLIVISNIRKTPTIETPMNSRQDEVNGLFDRNEFLQLYEVAMKSKYSRLFENKYIDKY